MTDECENCGRAYGDHHCTHAWCPASRGSDFKRVSVFQSQRVPALFERGREAILKMLKEAEANATCGDHPDEAQGPLCVYDGNGVVQIVPSDEPLPFVPTGQSMTFRQPFPSVALHKQPELTITIRPGPSLKEIMAEVKEKSRGAVPCQFEKLTQLECPCPSCQAIRDMLPNGVALIETMIDDKVAAAPPPQVPPRRTKTGRWMVPAVSERGPR